MDANNLYGYAMSKFPPTGRFKWIDLKDLDLIKYSKNISEGCVFEVYFKYPEKLCEVHTEDPLAPGKIEIKKELLPKYQLLISDFYKIPIGNVKILVPNFFDKEKYVLHFENLQLYLKLWLKLEKMHHVLEFDQSQLLKPYVEFNPIKRIEAETNGD